MNAYTDVTGHQVDQYFLGRQLEQQAANDDISEDGTTE